MDQEVAHQRLPVQAVLQGCQAEEAWPEDRMGFLHQAADRAGHTGLRYLGHWKTAGTLRAAVQPASLEEAHSTPVGVLPAACAGARRG